MSCKGEKVIIAEPIELKPCLLMLGASILFPFNVDSIFY